MKRFKPRGFSQCPHCGSDKMMVRIDQYDAIACGKCHKWIEGRCSDERCEFCSKRPESPSACNWESRWNTHYRDD